MCLLTHFGLSIKCTLHRIRPYYTITKFSCDVFPNKTHNRTTAGHGIIHIPLHQCERLVCTYHMVKRFKYTKKQEESSDSEDEVETIEDVGKDFKLLKLRVNSLRTDLILKSALGMARNKVEMAFFQSKVRVNGAVLMKKSYQVKAEDEVDLVRGTSKLNRNFLVVSRVKIISYAEREDKYTVNVQCFRSLTIESYPDWKPSE